MLEVQELSVAYRGSIALSEVSVSVEQGGSVAILGSNGAGKTTLLKTISGLLRPTGGRILFEGDPIDGASPGRIVRRGIVHVPEGRQVFPDLNVSENLLVGAHHRRGARRGVESDRRVVLDLFPRLGDRLRQTAGTLSGGEQQMLVIGRAMMARPRLLLLDEPSLGLSPLMVKETFQAVRALHSDRQVSILLVEQNAKEALSSTSSAYVLSSGKVTKSGRSETLASDEELFNAYVGRKNGEHPMGERV